MDSIPDLEEVVNIQNMPDPYAKQLFSSKNRDIVTRIKKMGDNICRGHISDRYINRALNTFKYGLIYYKDSEIMGFAVWKEKIQIPSNMNKGDNYPPIPYMELLLICTKPNDYQIAPKIMWDLDNYCVSRGFEYIILEPANTDLIDIYNKYGFKINTTSRVKGLHMIKSSEPLKIPKVKKTRKIQRNKIKQGTIEHYNLLLHPLLQHEYSYENLDKLYNRPHPFSSKI